MPIYDYKCGKCSKISEIIVRREEDEAPSCPDCGSSNMQKLVSSSYLLRTENPSGSTTCCGRAERCDTPPCSGGGGCHRH